MRIVVTGAAGLTGSCVTRLLLDRGHEVVAGVRTRERAADVDARAQIAVVDLADAEALTPVIRSCDAVVHVAGIHLTDAVAGAVSRAGPARVVAVSSASAMVPEHPNARTYLGWEKRLRDARPDSIVVRPTMIYGSSRDRNVHKVVAFARRWRFLPVPASGGARIQPIHYVDLAGVIGGVVTADPGLTLAAGGPTPLSLEECARVIFTALGAPPRIVPVPVPPILAAARLWDRVRSSRIAPRVERSRIDRVVDIGPMTTITGISPRTFDAGVAALVDEMRATGAL